MSFPVRIIDRDDKHVSWAGKSDSHGVLPKKGDRISTTLYARLRVGNPLLKEELQLAYASGGYAEIDRRGEYAEWRQVVTVIDTYFDIFMTEDPDGHSELRYVVKIDWARPK